MPPIRDHPNILILAVNIDGGFVNMDEWSREDTLEYAPLRDGVLDGKLSDKITDRHIGKVYGKQLASSCRNHSNRHPE
jgi:hypothetical protein